MMIPGELFDFTGAVVCVTGASSPIGGALARRFAEAGADLVLHYHTGKERASKLAAELETLGGRAICLSADLSHPGQVKDIFHTVKKYYGRLNVLVNNAGLYPVTGILSLTDEEWERVIAANLSGVHYCTREAAVFMKGTGGAVVNISSIEAERPGYGHAHYAASKAGIIGYTLAAAQELGPEGIRVNAILPGLIGRPGLEADWPEGVAAYTSAAPLKRLGEAFDVANACLFLASPASSWITGATLRVDGGVGASRGY